MCRYHSQTRIHLPWLVALWLGSCELASALQIPQHPCSRSQHRVHHKPPKKPFVGNVVNKSPVEDLLSMASTDFSISPEAIWTLRVGSALTTYVAGLLLLDRPRGQLLQTNSLEVKTSTVPDAGLGVFATQFLPGGTVLGTYPGVVVPLPLANGLPKVQANPVCTAYVWRFSDNSAILDPTDAEGICQDYCLGGSGSIPGSQFVFQKLGLGDLVKIPTTLCRINEPPKGSDVNVVTEENLQEKTVVFTLERDVGAGEELFIDYGLSYDRSFYSSAPNLPDEEPE